MRREQGHASSGSILLRMKIEAKEHLHMTAVLFDSLTLVKRLRVSGIPDEQAESIVEMTRDALAQTATRADIDAAMRVLEPKFVASDQRFHAIEHQLSEIELRLAALEQRLSSVEQRLGALEHRFELIEQKFTILEQRLTMKLGTIVVLALGAFTAISKLIG